MKRALALLGVLLLAGCQYPDITLKGEPRPAVALDKVNVVNSEPQNAQVLGLVYAWSPLPVDGAAGYDDAVEKLRARAASIGANVLYVPPKAEIQLPRIQSRWMWPQEGYREDGEYERPQNLMGRAYYIP